MWEWLKLILGQDKKESPHSPVRPLVESTDQNVTRYTREALTGTCPPTPVPPKKETKLTTHYIKDILGATHDYTTFVIEPPILGECTDIPDQDRQNKATTQSKIAGDYFCTEISKLLSEYVAKPIMTGSTRAITYTGRSTPYNTQRFASDDPDCNLEAFIRGIEKEKDKFKDHIWPHINLYLKDENGESYFVEPLCS